MLPLIVLRLSFGVLVLVLKLDVKVLGYDLQPVRIVFRTTRVSADLAVGNVQ